MKDTEHPTVLSVRKTLEAGATQKSDILNADFLRELCLRAGADDVGFVEIDRPALGDEKEAIKRDFPRCKALIGYASRMNREPLRSPARSIANLEFHHVGDKVNDVGREIVRELEAIGVGAINPSMGFPMEMDRFPERIWVVSHKLVAQQAGLGVMGIHRNVIHPKFGNFILLGTILIDTEVTQYDVPIDYNPCLECKLCVAACPVGAIGSDGYFNFNACYTHNYREFMGGFSEWTEELVESKTKNENRPRTTNRRRCGKAFRLVPTTRQPTASQCALLAKMC